MSIKHLIVFLASILVVASAHATMQQPDILYLEDQQLCVDVGWGHPAPLDTYFQSKRINSPFRGISTGNYRGYVAVWEIAEGQLFLRQIKEADFIGDEKKRKYTLPRVYGVYSKSAPRDDGAIIADWFTGVLCVYDDVSTRQGDTYFYIENGAVIDSGPHLSDLYRKYVTYYYQLCGDDIEIGDKSSRLATGATHLSPLFGYYDNDPFNWPYHWAGTNKTGAPHVLWLVKEKCFYVKQLTLKSGLQLFTDDEENLPLETIFPGDVVDGLVKADWINGVFLIEHGEVKIKHPEWGTEPYETFEVESYQMIRVSDGMIIESREVDENVFRTGMLDEPDDVLEGMLVDYGFSINNGWPFVSFAVCGACVACVGGVVASGITLVNRRRGLVR